MLLLDIILEMKIVFQKHYQTKTYVVEEVQHCAKFLNNIKIDI